MIPTPQEKAVELYTKYEQLGRDFTRGVSMNEFAKQCALIAVHELIKYHDDLMDVVRYELPSNIVAVIPYKYWDDVKKEIERL
jgi:hypothetical protein